MITLKDLKEYDIKNIDPGKLLKTIQQRKDILASMALIVVTLIALNNITTKQKMKARDLAQKVSASEKKTKAIADYEKAKKDLTALVGSLPQGLPETDSIIEKINSFAIDHNLQIASFAPSGRVDNEFYSQVNLKLNVTSPSYENLAQFVKDIENSTYNLRVEHWTAKIENKPKRLNLKEAIPAESQPQIMAELELSSIYFKNEK